LFAFCVNNFRIRSDKFNSLAVHHKKTKIKADLRSGEANALGVVHGVKHVIAEFLKPSIEFSYWLPDFREDAFGVLSDLSDGHVIAGSHPVAFAEKNPA
jgi:hypothetical protein